MQRPLVEGDQKGGNGRVQVSPRADYELCPGDKIVMIGSNEAIARLRTHLS